MRTSAVLGPSYKWLKRYGPFASAVISAVTPPLFAVTAPLLVQLCPIC